MTNYCKYRMICDYHDNNNCTKSFQDNCEQKRIYEIKSIKKEKVNKNE